MTEGLLGFKKKDAQYDCPILKQEDRGVTFKIPQSDCFPVVPKKDYAKLAGYKNQVVEDLKKAQQQLAEKQKEIKEWEGLGVEMGKKMADNGFELEKVIAEKDKQIAELKQCLKELISPKLFREVMKAEPKKERKK